MFDNNPDNTKEFADILEFQEYINRKIIENLGVPLHIIHGIPCGSVPINGGFKIGDDWCYQCGFLGCLKCGKTGK